MTEAIKSENFIAYLEPYLFDLLKRHEKFTNLCDKILNFANKNKEKELKEKLKILKLIDEKLLLSAFIELVSIEFQPRLGYFIAKNDYPVPIQYQYFDYQKNSVEVKVNFDILSHLLCLTSKCIAIVSGTSNALYKGKTSLISLAFPDLNPNSTIKSKHYSDLSHVDVICNDETSENWIIADFHGQVKIKESINLLKSFSVFADIHILNVTINDFNDDHQPSDEIKEILRWHTILNKENQTLVVILIRDIDYENSDSDSDDNDDDDNDKECKLDDKIDKIT